MDVPEKNEEATDFSLGVDCIIGLGGIRIEFVISWTLQLTRYKIVPSMGVDSQRHRTRSMDSLTPAEETMIEITAIILSRCSFS